MLEQLVTFIENLKRNPNISKFDEASTKQAVILPILHLLGWNIFDVSEVMPELSTGNGRVDYSLKKPDGSNKAFIEAKKASEDLQQHEEQLLVYSFHEGVEIAALTNGITWWFYLPTQKGDWKERKFFTIDLIQQDPRDAAEKFTDLLSKINILSGVALENAEHIYKDRQRKTKIEDALPEAWLKLISEPDPLLIDLLAEATEKLCGFKPDNEAVKVFLNSCREATVPKESVPAKATQLKRQQIVDRPQKPRIKAGKVTLQELVDAGLLRNGQTLFFCNGKHLFNDEKVTIIATANKIKYEKDGKVYSISELAAILLRKHGFKHDNHGVAGPWYWQTYDGRLLHDLNEVIRTRRGDRG